MTDPIADFLIQLKNGYLGGKETVRLPYGQLKYNIAQVLRKEGYIGRVEVGKGEGIQKTLTIELLYRAKKPKMKDVKRISKPGKRVYAKKNTLPKILGGKGMALISTPDGLLTDRQARQKRVGGEVLCAIW